MIGANPAQKANSTLNQLTVMSVETVNLVVGNSFNIHQTPPSFFPRWITIDMK